VRRRRARRLAEALEGSTVLEIRLGGSVIYRGDLGTLAIACRYAGGEFTLFGDLRDGEIGLLERLEVRVIALTS
jgi:hypothetical protein